jgi:hypothetical protein
MAPASAAGVRGQPFGKEKGTSPRPFFFLATISSSSSCQQLLANNTEPEEPGRVQQVAAVGAPWAKEKGTQHRESF